MATDIKRLNYFTGQFLEAADFTQEQTYHIDMRRLGNRALYWSAGILDNGFAVSLDQTDSTKIIVSPGIGIDTQGREMVLAAPLEVSLTPEIWDKVSFVTLRYNETPTDFQTAVPEGNEPPVSDYTRMKEKPSVTFVESGTQIDSDWIVIAKITLDSSGAVVGSIDMSVRQRANGRFPDSLVVGQGANGVLTVRHIDGKNWQNDNKDDLFLNWNTSKNVYLGFGDNTKSSLFVSGNATIGSGQPSENHKLVMRGPNSPGNQTGHQDVSFEFDNAGSAKVRAYRGSSWDTYLQFLTNGSNAGADNSQVRMHIDHLGNVGIGTENPLYRLHVVADGGVGSEDANGISLPGKVPLVVQSDSTVFAVLNKDRRQSFALNIEGNAGSSTERGMPVFYDKFDSVWHPSIYLKNGNVGIGGAPSLNAKLQITGGAIMPDVGNSNNAGILFPSNPGGGAGDVAWIRYYAKPNTEKTALEIGVANDVIGNPNTQDDILLMPSGGVGVNTDNVKRTLHVQGQEIHSGGDGAGFSFSDRGQTTFVDNPASGERWVWYASGGNARLWSGKDRLSITPNGRLTMLENANPIMFSEAWQGFPDNALNKAEICNDTGTYKTLMIVGNRSNDSRTRRVSVWDRLEVNGTLNVGSENITNPFIVQGKTTDAQAKLQLQNSTNYSLIIGVEENAQGHAVVFYWKAGNGRIYKGWDLGVDIT